MKRFALLLTAVAALFVAQGETSVAQDVRPASVVGGHVHVHYQVLYFRGHHWYVYGTYNSHSQAHSVAHHLNHHGYATQIRTI